MGSVKSDTPFLLLKPLFSGGLNKKSIDLPFGIMLTTKKTLQKGNNAHEHYTLFTSNHPPTLSAELLAY